jgi:hypothetical protein
MANTANPGERGCFSALRKAATVLRLLREWLIERHGYRSPVQVRRDLTAPIPSVA